MTRSHNSRRGSEANLRWRPYAGAHVSKARAQRPCFDLDLDDFYLYRHLHFDRSDEAEYADAEVKADDFADSDEEQLWTALSATTETQLASDLCSDDWDTASEWTLVSTAESSWVVEWEADGAQPAAVLAPWPEEGASDAAIAAQLQDDERTSAGIGRFVIGRGAYGWRHPTRVPVVGLVARMGVCVVCSESVATVIMEPCGHLAMCGSCSESWTNRTCVLCRCPCTRIHLLSGATPNPLSSVSAGLAVERSSRSGDVRVRLCVWPLPPPHESVDEGVGVSVRLADGLVTIPSIERSIALCDGPAHSTTKLERRQAKHRYSRERRQKLSVGDPTLAGGARGKQALQAHFDEAWELWHQECVRWRLARNQSRAVLRETPHAWRGQVRRTSFRWWSTEPVVKLILQVTAPRPDFYSDRFLSQPYHRAGHRARGRGTLFCGNIRFDQKFRTWTCAEAAARTWSGPSPGQKQEVLRQEAMLWKEEHRRERKEMEAKALLAATKVAAVATRRLQEPLECAACGQGEACMMHLPCRHVALCQRCFDTTWQSDSPCARCGTASHVSLCVRRA